jgi:hypothetical protein
MRFSTAVVLLFFPATLFAQQSPCAPAPSSLAEFDPYKPSHLSIIRNYGGTMLAQAPIDTLLKLDPYVPSEGALLRQLGGAIPVWSYPPYAWQPPAVHSSPCEPVRETASAVLTSFSDVVAELGPGPSNAVAPVSRTTAERSRGISIEYDGRVWASAGPAVGFSETDFVRIGERAGGPIYQRSGSKDAVIYIPTTSGMVAPFRAAK